MRDRARLDTPVVVGGTIPASDVTKLRALGVTAVFPVGTPLPRCRATGSCRGWSHGSGSSRDRRADGRTVTTDAGHPGARDVYTAADVDGPDGSPSGSARPGEPPFTRGPVPVDVPRAALDDAAVRRVRVARGGERAVPVPARSRARPRSRSRSTCRPSSATTPTTRPRSAEVGRVGVAIDTADDMVDLFAGLPLDEVSVNFTINATAPIILAMYLVAAERQGVAPERPGRHAAERHPEGVPGPQDVSSSRPSPRCGCRATWSSTPSRAPAAVQPDLDHRLPRARGRMRRDPGARAHAGVRDRVLGGADRARAGVRRVRPPAVLPLRHHAWICSRRWRSSAPRGACGTGSRPSASARRTRTPAGSGSSPGTPARRSRRSSR